MNIRTKRFAPEQPSPTPSSSEPLKGGLRGIGAIGLNRRSFLVRSSMAAATAGFIAAVPGGTALLGAAETEAPAVEADAAPATDAEAASMSDPVVAHVKDLSTGEISIYSGDQEVVLRNPGLAAQLFRASR
jgi:hypothetical protein